VGGGGSGSLINEVEAECVRVLVGEMMAPPHALAPTDIAIICLYRAQVQRVREKLGCFGGAGESILVGTVDACQGQERSVVVLTTCASQGGGGGALGEPAAPVRCPLASKEPPADCGGGNGPVAVGHVANHSPRRSRPAQWGEVH
jgi:hypothetical protein